jgi:hypothetical protein
MIEQIVLQPTSNKDSRRHYADTVDAPVPLERVREVLGASVTEELRASGAGGSVAIWGVTPGVGGVNERKWQRLRRGACALFCRDGHVVASGRIIHKLRSEALAVALWGRDARDDTWEYIYFLTDVSTRWISYAELNSAAGYAPGNQIQGFNVLDEERSARVAASLGLADGGAQLTALSREGGLVLVENEATAGGRFDDWKDVTGERYHFPNQYRTRVDPGRRFIYYRGVRRLDGRRGPAEYFGTGTIGAIWRDPDVPDDAPKQQWKWFCDIENYEPFVTPVPARVDGVAFEEIADNEWGVGIRPVEGRTVLRVVEYGGLRISPIAEGKPPPTVPSLDDVKPRGGDSLLIPRRAKSRSSEVSGGGSRRSPYALVVGRRGEEIAMKYLRETLSVGEAASLRWIADEGDKPGWDIGYVDGSGRSICVEVKATVGGAFTAIEITAGEWNAARHHRERYRLLLVASALSDTPTVSEIVDPASLADRGVLSVTPMVLRIEALSPIEALEAD